MEQAKPQDLIGCRIMIVEDEYMIADDMVQAFKKSGAVIIGPVPSVDRALALLRATDRIDGAVLDINLQGENVFPIADELKARGVPFVFATGYDRWVVPEPYQDAPHCEKPVAPERVAYALFG
jgi:two-component SAPR family response regulator